MTTECYWTNGREHCSTCGAEDEYRMNGNGDKVCRNCGAINTYEPYADKRTGLGVPAHVVERVRRERLRIAQLAGEQRKTGIPAGRRVATILEAALTGDADAIAVHLGLLAALQAFENLAKSVVAERAGGG